MLCLPRYPGCDRLKHALLLPHCLMASALVQRFAAEQEQLDAQFAAARVQGFRGHLGGAAAPAARAGVAALKQHTGGSATQGPSRGLSTDRLNACLGAAAAGAPLVVEPLEQAGLNKKAWCCCDKQVSVPLAPACAPLAPIGNCLLPPSPHTAAAAAAGNVTEVVGVPPHHSPGTKAGNVHRCGGLGGLLHGSLPAGIPSQGWLGAGSGSGDEGGIAGGGCGGGGGDGGQGVGGSIGGGVGGGGGGGGGVGGRVGSSAGGRGGGGGSSGGGGGQRSSKQCVLCGVHVKQGQFCSQDCYTQSCEAHDAALRLCSQGGCDNVLVPGLPLGSKCSTCYLGHRNACKVKDKQDGRACGNRGCPVVLHQQKPKFGKFCSLACGSDWGSCCVGCGLMDAFHGSQDPERCALCYNAKQAAAKKRKRG